MLRKQHLCWRLPIVPGRFQPSIVGTSELNCCVRDGNRCTLTVINTNSSGRYSRTLRTEQRNLVDCEKKLTICDSGHHTAYHQKMLLHLSNL